MAIKFGTDGWRAIIGEDYTFANVRKVLQAFCDLNKNSQNKKIIIGYDRRFSGKEFAEAATEVLLGNGFSVLLSESFCPTPAISWMTKHKKALAGVVITASHNPYRWNGVKFKESYGGSASPEYTAKIEAQVEKNDAKARKVKRMSLEEGQKARKLKYFHPHSEYVGQLKRMVDVAAIRRSKIKIVVDTLHGAGSGFFTALLGKQVIEIRGDDNPGFGGVNPEPIAQNLAISSQAVRANKAAIGLATDGDADRIGALDEKGRFVNSHQIFSLILRHLAGVKKWKGDVIKTVSTTKMVDRLAERYGRHVVETPIGFKHICQEFLKTTPLMGGEESGGLGFAKHVYERDGILSGLFLLEIMAYHGKSLSALIKDLQKEVGPLYFRRDDMHIKPEKVKQVKHALGNGVAPHFSAFHLEEKSRKDGFKYFFSDGSWLLIRPSGTEPVLRVYAESSSQRKADELIAAGKKMISKC